MPEEYQNKIKENFYFKYEKKENFELVLGSIIHNEKEMKQYRGQISLLFQQLSQETSGWENAWQKIEDSFVDFATKGSDSQSIRDSVAARADMTFERMKGYWSLLV